MSKDVNLAQSAANRSNVELPAARAAAQVFDEALAEAGELDISSIVPFVFALAGRKSKNQHPSGEGKHQI